MRVSFNEDNGFLCISADILDKKNFQLILEEFLKDNGATATDFRTGKSVEIGSIFLVKNLEIMGIISKDTELSRLQHFGLLARVKFHERQDKEVYDFFEDELSSVIVEHYEPAASV